MNRPRLRLIGEINERGEKVLRTYILHYVRGEAREGEEQVGPFVVHPVLLREEPLDPESDYQRKGIFASLKRRLRLVFTRMCNAVK